MNRTAIFVLASFAWLSALGQPGSPPDFVNALNGHCLGRVQAGLAQGREVLVPALPELQAYCLLAEGMAGEQGTELRARLGMADGPNAFREQVLAWQGVYARGYDQADGLFGGYSVWVNRATGLHDRFLRYSESHHGANLRSAAFRHDPIGAARDVGQWLEQASHHRFRAGQAPERFDTACRLVATAALDIRFVPARPLAPFDTLGIQAARGQVEALWFQAPGWQALWLDSREGKAQLLLLVPAEKTGLARQAAALDPATLAEWRAQATLRGIDLLLPAGPIAQQARLEGAFAEADFSLMTDLEPLRLEAFISLASFSLEASATAVQPAGPDALAFHALGPLVFFVLDKPSGAWVMGGALDFP